MKPSMEIKILNFRSGWPYKIVVKDINSIIINDILIGDVWLCFDQSLITVIPRCLLMLLNFHINITFK